MNILFCNKSKDNEIVSKIINEYYSSETESIVYFFRETEQSSDWKDKIIEKIKKVEIVLFLFDSDILDSESIEWEIKQAKKFKKYIVALNYNKVETANYEGTFDRFFEDLKSCINYYRPILLQDYSRSLEQYKLMIASTEKVTSQRLKVNNLFFTVTSSVLSFSFYLGKSLEFSDVGVLTMLLVSFLAFLISFFWEKLITSYGKLNQGKFIVIDELEKKLRTSMFSEEWHILTQQVNYEPNTKTEYRIIKIFRQIILVFIVLLTLYLILKHVKFC